MNVSGGEADFLDGRDISNRNIGPALSAMPLHFTPCLCYIIFIGEPTLCTSLAPED